MPVNKETRLQRAIRRRNRTNKSAVKHKAKRHNGEHGPKCRKCAKLKRKLEVRAADVKLLEDHESAVKELDELRDQRSSLVASVTRLEEKSRAAAGELEACKAALARACTEIEELKQQVQLRDEKLKGVKERFHKALGKVVAWLAC